jgi:glycosyltransferase involved in cell wall biosynthesis
MRTDAPRVAIVAASLEILGGQGVQARSLVDALRGDGQSVAFVPINPRFPPPLGRLRKLRGVRTVVNQALYLPALARLAKVDVAHVFSASYASFLLAPLPAMLVARALNKRVVLHYHSGEADDHLSNWGVLVHPWLRLAHHIVVPSVFLRDVFARHGHEAHVIPNVVDLSQFVYRERRPLRPRLLSTRNLEPHYRVDVIVQAYARLKRVVPAASLTIAGYGSEEPRLRRLVEAGGLSDVTFVGKVDPTHMPHLYDGSDIFLNASVVDNQPVSILEAFASGLPVVSTPTGDIGALVRHRETGLLVPPFDPDAIAQAVLWLLANPDAALACAERAHHSTAHYTWPAVRDAWAAIYGSTGRQAAITPCPSTSPHQTH